MYIPILTQIVPFLPLHPVGIMVGSFFWGAFANIYGRKLSFLLSGLVISAGGFLTAAAPNYVWLLLIRAVVGFGIGMVIICTSMGMYVGMCKCVCSDRYEGLIWIRG
ncbi:hypothetical protein EON63_20355 [archaeon]|nr:MAG: hypothetical protein EON63_20355 [archaeon]